jgi:hypothetical protein
MAKVKISEFSATPASNTDIDGINIAEGCAPSGINDAIRELMAQLKDFQTGAVGDSFNGPVGTSTAAAGAFTTLSATGVTTVQAGSAGAPAITTSGDTNTGIFFPAADTIAFSEGGVETARFDSAGNLGLGVTPSAWGTDYKALQIAGYAAFAQRPAGSGDLILSWNAFNTSGNTSGSGYVYKNTGDVASSYEQNGAHRWYVAPSGTAGNAISFTQAMTLDASGNLLVGVSSGSSHIFSKNAGNGAGTTSIFEIQNAGADAVAIFLSGTSFGTSNSAGTALRIGRSNTTTRSINAGGTINASGADYAEYMTKAGDFTVAKGDVLGINADGKLTNVFADAVSFCVKSTDPSYVGNDKWGCDFSEDPDGLEAARQLVDRIAFAGQVPVNVMGATSGQYIIPINDNGAIRGIAKDEADMTLVEYMRAVGKVIAVQDDGRAFIIVKVA